MSNAISSVSTTFSNLSSARHKMSVVNDVLERKIINSPLLFDMLANMSSIHKHTILDVGRVSGSSIEFFGDYWCKLYISNSVSEIHKLDPAIIDTPHKWHRALVKTLEFYKRKKADLDVILLWDLLNYLTPDHLDGLISYLLPHSSERVLIHAYLYSARQMPAVPANYHILKDNTVAIDAGSAIQTDCPMYHQTVLQKYMSPLKVNRAVMLSSGIQEYLFQLK